MHFTMMYMTLLLLACSTWASSPFLCGMLKALEPMLSRHLFTTVDRRRRMMGAYGFCGSVDLICNIPCAAEHDPHGVCSAVISHTCIASQPLHTVICKASSECVLSLWLSNTPNVAQRSDFIIFS